MIPIYTKNNTLHFEWEKKEDLKKIVTLLENNAVGIGTTDTIPGFFSQLTPEGHSRLSMLKEERGNKPFLIVTNAKHLDFFIDLALLDPRYLSIINNCWPGPLTLVLKARPALPSWMTSAQGTIALRIPNHEGINCLLQSHEGFFSSSANRSNHVTPTTLHEVEPSLLEKVDFIVRPHKTKELVSKQSTIVDCTHDVPQVLREGAFLFSEVMHYYDHK